MEVKRITTLHLLHKMNTISLRTFSVKYIGATNTRPSRVKITELRSGKKKIISYNHDFNNAWEIAADFLSNRIGIKITHYSNGGPDVDYISTEDFTTDFAY